MVHVGILRAAGHTKLELVLLLKAQGLHVYVYSFITSAAPTRRTEDIARKQRAPSSLHVGLVHMPVLAAHVWYTVMIGTLPQPAAAR